MVHQYKNNGYNIVLDVNSGAVHVVDDAAYDVISLWETHSAEEIENCLAPVYGASQVREATDEVAALIKEEALFSKDIYEDSIANIKQRKTVVKALCLHIAHDCNLKCRYCFAGEGEYHGKKAWMSFETGKAALDFLIANSGGRRNGFFWRRADA